MLDIQETLAYIQENSVFLHFDDDPARLVDLWSPQHKQPMALRRAVYKYRAQLLAMMLTCDSRACPSPAYHRKYWRKSGIKGQKTCTLCQRIDASLAAASIETNELRTA